MFNLVVRIVTRELKHIEPLLSAQSSEGVIDAPAYIRSASLYVRLPEKTCALDEEESAICILWVLLEEVGDGGRELRQSSLVYRTHLKRCVSSEGPTTWNESTRTC